MSDLEKLNHEERVFLAGCIRAIILADGTFRASELDDLDSIYRRLGFDDYEACLEEFESRIKDEDGFWQEARRTDRTAARDVILQVAYELTLQNGVPDPSQENIEQKLRALWKKS